MRYHILFYLFLIILMIAEVTAFPSDNGKGYHCPAPEATVNEVAPEPSNAGLYTDRPMLSVKQENEKKN